MTAVLGGLDRRTFLRDHWQQTPLVVRGAVEISTPVVDAATLLDLACEEDVESRLVIADGGDWACEHGPFEPSRFDALPDAGWTLLVQNVDAWIAEVAGLLDRFDFLPRWRLDDVMVSLAADGGGVGPHFDWYDVFLLQTSGIRRWEVGPPCDAATAPREHPDLRLLPDFEPVAVHRLGPGDLLYLPAGVAHRGTAEGADCITCSIGFRAPATADLAAGLAEHLAPLLPEDLRYRDPPGGIDADPYLINDVAVAEIVRGWRAIAPDVVEGALARAFATLITEPRTPPEADDGAATRLAGTTGDLAVAHAAASRFAYRPVGDRAELYVDGAAYPVSAAFAKGICHGRLPASVLAEPTERDVLLALVKQGSIEVSSA